MTVRLCPQDTTNGINVWPLLLFHGQELTVFPPVYKMDEQVSGNFRERNKYI